MSRDGADSSLFWRVWTFQGCDVSGRREGGHSVDASGHRCFSNTSDFLNQRPGSTKHIGILHEQTNKVLVVRQLAETRWRGHLDWVSGPLAYQETIGTGKSWAQRGTDHALGTQQWGACRTAFIPDILDTRCGDSSAAPGPTMNGNRTSKTFPGGTLSCTWLVSSPWGWVCVYHYTHNPTHFPGSHLNALTHNLQLQIGFGRQKF